MWQLQTSWYELVIRSIVIFFFTFILIRIWGKKHLAQVNLFDFMLLLIMSESLQNSLVGDEKSITGGIIAISTLILCNVFLNKISFNSKKAEKILEGVPKVLIKNGKVNEEIKNNVKITDAELLEALRMEGVNRVNDVAEAVMEANGHITVIKKEGLRSFFH